MNNLSFSSRYKNGIYIKLGYACNGLCVYCAQKGYAVKTLELNEDIIDYVALQSSVKRKCSQDKYYIVFYGGEPLLYWENLRNIVLRLHDNSVFNKENVAFICITNGVLLTDEIVKFFNLYDIRCRLSYDGPDETTRPVRLDVKKKKLFMQLNNKDIYFVWSVDNSSMIKSKIYLERLFPAVDVEMVMCRFVANDPELKKYVINSKSMIIANFKEIIQYYKWHKTDGFLVRLLSNKFYKNNDIEVIDIAGNRHHSCDYPSECGDIYTAEKISINIRTKHLNDNCVRCCYYDICNGSRRSNMENGNIYECEALRCINNLYQLYKNVLFGYLARDGYRVNSYSSFHIIEKVLEK